MSARKPTPNILDFDWEKVLDQIQKDNPNTNDLYMLVFNKGQASEYRTRFMSYKEALEFIFLGREKKKLRISTTL